MYVGVYSHCSEQLIEYASPLGKVHSSDLQIL